MAMWSWSSNENKRRCKIMMDELWREEEKKTLERIAKLTELGKVK